MDALNQHISMYTSKLKVIIHMYIADVQVYPCGKQISMITIKNEKH